MIAKSEIGQPIAPLIFLRQEFEPHQRARLEMRASLPDERCAVEEWDSLLQSEIHRPVRRLRGRAPRTVNIKQRPRRGRAARGRGWAAEVRQCVTEAIVCRI